MDWLHWTGAILVPIVGVMGKAYFSLRDRVSKHDTALAVVQESCAHLTELAEDSKAGREAVLTVVETVRKESTRQHENLRNHVTKQHEILRNEQREDAASIRRAIAAR